MVTCKYIHIYAYYICVYISIYINVQNMYVIYIYICIYMWPINANMREREIRNHEHKDNTRNTHNHNDDNTTKTRATTAAAENSKERGMHPVEQEHSKRASIDTHVLRHLLLRELRLLAPCQKRRWPFCGFQGCHGALGPSFRAYCFKPSRTCHHGHCFHSRGYHVCSRPLSLSLSLLSRSLARPWLAEAICPCVVREASPRHLLPSQRFLHDAPIFRLLLKVAVNGTHQCDFLNFCGALGPNKSGTAAQVCIEDGRSAMSVCTQRIASPLSVGAWLSYVAARGPRGAW